MGILFLDAAPVTLIPILLFILLPIIAILCVIIAVVIIHHRHNPK